MARRTWVGSAVVVTAFLYVFFVLVFSCTSIAGNSEIPNQLQREHSESNVDSEDFWMHVAQQRSHERFVPDPEDHRRRCGEGVTSQFSPQTDEQLLEYDLTKLVQRYACFHADTVSGRLNSVSRFIVYRGSEINREGLGNRVVSLFTAFMYGLTTNRAFMVDWPETSLEYSLMDFFAPELPIQWDINHPEVPTEVYDHDEAMHASWTHLVDIRAVLWWANAYDNSSSVWYDSPWGYLSHFIEHPRARLVIPLFEAVLTTQQRDEWKKGHATYLLFGLLSRILFRMPTFDSEETQYWTQAMQKAGKVIGVQCRRNKLHGDAKEKDFMARFTAAYQRRVFDCALSLDDGQASFMLFYDDPGCVHDFVDMFPSGRTIYRPNVVAVHSGVGRPEDMPIDNYRSGLAQVRMDWWLASRLDDLVIYFHSTFLSTAFARTGVLPVVVPPIEENASRSKFEEELLCPRSGGTLNNL